MNVLIAADIFPPDAGGPATYVVSLANALTARGVSVRIVSLNPQSDARAVRCPLSAVRSTHKVWRYLQYARLLIQHARWADVLYAMGPVNAGFPALLVAWLCAKPFAVKVVGDYAWEQGVQRFGIRDRIDDFERQASDGMVYFLRRLQAFVVAHAARVIVPCRYLKGLVEGWGVEGKMIHVVYNAVEAPLEPPRAKPRGEQWAVSVGRLVPWKGMAALIDVVAELRDAAPNLRLKIVGDGPERERLETRVRNLQAFDRVEFLGALPRREVSAVVAAADIFVLNSGYEGLSHVLLEALAAGVPTIASRAGGNGEILPDSQLFLFDDRQEMREKILFTLNARPTVPLTDAFSVEKMIERTQEVLASVITK